MAHGIFDLAAENFQEPHVSQEVKPSAVQEKSGHKGKVIDQGQAVRAVMPGIFRRHDPEIIYEPLEQIIRQGRLEIEDNAAECYDQPGGEGESSVGDRVFDREHGSGMYLNRLCTQRVHDENIPQVIRKTEAHVGENEKGRSPLILLGVSSGIRTRVTVLKIWSGWGSKCLKIQRFTLEIRELGVS